MTPAEKPRLRERNFVLVFLANREMALPIPVESPAMAVSPNASHTLFSMFMILLIHQLEVSN